MTEIKKNYNRGKIYTIRNIKDDKMIYVGSTRNSLSKRFTQHKIHCRNKGLGSLYKHIIDNDWSNWYIELYELYPCNNKQELNRREGEVIREIGTINKNVAGRTKKESDKLYYENNKEHCNELTKNWIINNFEKNKDYKQNYYIQNKSTISDKCKIKVCCEICGSFIRGSDVQRHRRSKKCMGHSTAENANYSLKIDSLSYF